MLMYVRMYSEGLGALSMDQPGKVANPTRPSSCVTPAGTSNELDVQNEWEENTLVVSAEHGKLFFPCPRLFAPENLVSRDGFGSPVPRQPAHLHSQAGSGNIIPGIGESSHPVVGGIVSISHA